MIESLEDRRLLTVSQELVSQLEPYQNALNNALDVATSLPLVGDQLTSLQKWNTVFQDSLNSLASKVDSLANGRFELAVPLPSFSDTFRFDLGLDAFLQIHTAGGVSIAVNPVLNVGFNLSDGVPSLDPTHTGLDINFVIGLPDFQLTASVNGLLYTKAVDAGTTFSGTLGFNFDTGFRIQPKFAGDAHIRLGFSLSLVDPATNASFNPRFFTTFELDWGFDTNGTSLKVPRIAFRNFSLDADSFMQGFLGDTVKAVQKFTKPMQPFIDMFEQPVPILSAFDSSETMGDLFLRGAGMSEEQQDRFNTMVKIVKAVNSFDFAGTTGGAVINFGDINLSGDARFSGQFLFETSGLGNVIDDIMSAPELEEVQEKLEVLAEYAGFSANAGFKYPLLEDPGPVIGSLLTGQPEIMFSYTMGRQHFKLEASLGVGIPGLLGIFLEAGIIFDANLSVGYDSAGLIKFLQDPQKRPENLLHGFYIDNGIDTIGPPIPGVPNPRNTAVYLQGYAALAAEAGVKVSGGLYADISFELASNSISTHVYLDDIINGLASNAKVFNPSGSLYSQATIEFSIPNPVGPDITLYEQQLSYNELLSFNKPKPPGPTSPLTVIDVNNQHSLLLDVNKMTPGGHVKVQPVHDFPISEGIGYYADGIRVDYPNEIVIYVERKNDITTNYYNFIGISGTVPDGVSIDIVDPFTVFSTEGAPDPQPAQTESGILLAGGKNVIYKYTEAPGGSKATVLLAGGYGSNTLVGGTMLFGNFIPAARIGQAKSHFGDITGFDSAGQTYVNARIDALLAPAIPAGVIGATLTSRRGGLMYGGAGNNSFFASGPGNYEMIGGAWTNTFTMSPSFGGVPATYQIDGGPFGKSTLVVQVPADENVVFENSSINDKYNSTLKALAVTANAGLSATAHGIKKVQIVSKTGASVLIGDTSLLNTEFAIKGGAQLTFGGTNAPDTFSVTTTGPYHGDASHFYPLQPITSIYTEPGMGTRTLLFGWGDMPPNPLPVYYVTRTFGTSGRTQTIPFAVYDTKVSSIKLNAGGASDTYSINVGLGAFIDVSVIDSDVSTTNALTVSTTEGSLFYNSLNFTDTAVEFDYYTFSYIWSNVTQYNTYYPYTTIYYKSSVHYTPTITFSGNIVPTVRAAIAFEHTTINRPLAPQAAELYVGGAYTTTPIPYFGLSGVIGVWDVSTQPWTSIPLSKSNTATDAQIIANSGSLLINQSVSTPLGTNRNAVFSVVGNTGTLNFVNSIDVAMSYATVVNVLGNSGTINIREASVGMPYFAPRASAQVNVGAGSLVNISGAINLTNTSGIVSLKIDDRLNPGPADSWQSSNEQTIIGDLTIRHAVNQTGLYADLVSAYEAYPKVGSLFAFQSTAPFYTQKVNDSALPTDLLLSKTIVAARRGEKIREQITGSGPGTLTYSATGLPPGLTISHTGLITGTISSTATAEYYNALVQVIRDGKVGRISIMSWYIASSIQLVMPESLSFVRQIEGTSPPADPVTATNLANRPVTFSATNLPPGITLNPTTGRFEGTYAIGSAQNPYYISTIRATDGFDSTSLEFYWYVTGITLVSPGNQFNRLGDMVNLPISFSIASGAAGTVYFENLPDGLTFDSATRRITGTVSATAQRAQHVRFSVVDGNDSALVEFDWVTLPVGISNYLDFYAIGDRHVHEEDILFFTPSIYNSLNLPITYTVEGLPPGLSIRTSESGWSIGGTVSAGAAANSPYHVQLHATDGNWSDSTSFDISVSVPGTVSFEGANYTQTNAPYDTVGFYVNASSSLGETITYFAVGLPPGMSIDSQSGLITGDLVMSSSLPISYKVTVTATAASGSDITKFNWNFIGGHEEPHSAVIAYPGRPLVVSSPVGTELLFTYTPSFGASQPTGFTFPLGYFTFAIRNLAPGQAADLTISGLNLDGFDSYLQNGSTPANAARHWYQFLFGQATDSDSAVGTGMEIVDGKLVLHLIDGGRGDDDLAKNGVIFGAGGPAKKVSQPPVIAGFGGTVTFTENGSPVILDNDATITDPDSLNFADGKLTIVTAVNAEATDRVRVKHTGNGAGQIGVDGFNIKYGGTLIGTFTGASALVVRLNANATPAAVQALLRNVTYAALTEAPSALNRTMRVTLTDGDGGTSATVTSTVRVIAVNDRPVITGFAGQVTYTENGPAVILDSDATVTDVDSPNFDTGKLTIAIIGNAESTDRIRIRHTGNAAGQIGVSGTTLSYGGVAIGTFTGATALVIALNSKATPASVQALLRNATYFTASDTPSTLNRTVRVYLTDGDGGTSTLSAKTVQVIAANDAPVIGSFGANVKYLATGPAIAVAATATVSDADSSNFSSGVLTLATTLNVQATDLFAIAHQGTGAGQIGVSGNNITFGGVSIGTQAGGSGSTPLTVTFNANANAAAVQALVRAITWRSSLTTPSTNPRTISLTLSDGDGDVTKPLTKRIEFL